jgi:tetratricopeptide (TPR) repeat protein
MADLLSVPTEGRYAALTANPQQKREMTFTALLDQLEGVASRSPVVIVFEDVHWIDPTSLDLLDRTIARVADLPVLLMVTFQPEFQPTWVGQAHVTLLPVGRLDRRESVGIVNGVTRGKALPDAVVEQVLVQTDGVPLFISQAKRCIIGAGRVSLRARSANLEAVSSFELALSLLESLPENQSTLEDGFEIRLELRSLLIQLGEVRRVLERLREAETLAEKLNDDNRRGRVWAFMTNVHGQLGELNEPLAWGSRALAIAHRLGNLELRILTTTYLVMVHYYRGEFERVVELATENLASLPPDRVHAHFGNAAPPSVFDRHCLAMSLAQLGKFAEAAEYESEAIRLAELSRELFSLALALFPAHTLGEVDAALIRVREGEQLLERGTSGGYVPYHGWAFLALGRASLLLGRLDEAQMRARRALDFCRRQPGFAAHVHHLLGDIAAHADRVDAQGAHGQLPPGAGTRRAARHATPRCALSPQRRQALPAPRQESGGAGSSHHGGDDVPANGYTVLAGAGERGDA